MEKYTKKEDGTVMSKIEKSTVQGEFIMFKDKPLVRQGHVLCYGSLQDDYIMQLMVMNNKDITYGDTVNSVPAMVIVQILAHNHGNGKWEQIKQFTKNGLYEAFTIGYSYIQGLKK